MKKNLILLLSLFLFCALFLSLLFIPTNLKIQKNQEAEIERNLASLFPSGKDLTCREEEPSFEGAKRQYRFTDSNGETAAFAIVFAIKDQHTNTFLFMAKKDGSLIGLRPLLTFGAHAFPSGEYNEAFLDSFSGQKAPFSLEESIKDSEYTHILRPLSGELNRFLSLIAKEGGEK